MSTATRRAWTCYPIAVVAALSLYGSASTAAPPKPATSARASASPAKRAVLPDDIQKVFVLQHAKAESIAFVLSVFPATISSVQVGSRMIGVSAAPAVMAELEETIKRLDDASATPPVAPVPTIAVTAYVLEATGQALPAAGSVPPQIEPVIAELRKTFQYADYRLADTLIARANADGATPFALDAVSEGGLSLAGNARYRFEAASAELVPGGDQKVVRLSGVRFRVGIPGAAQQPASTFDISATVDVRDGQAVIVGKSGTGQPGNAIILVLSAKIID
jgi:hypothetical protein